MQRQGDGNGTAGEQPHSAILRQAACLAAGLLLLLEVLQHGPQLPRQRVVLDGNRPLHRVARRFDRAGDLAVAAYAPARLASTTGFSG